MWLYTVSSLYNKFSPLKFVKSTLPFLWLAEETFTMRAGDDFFKRSDKDVKRNVIHTHKKKTESGPENRGETDVRSDLGADW